MNSLSGAQKPKLSVPENIPSLGQRLALIWLICGLGLLFMAWSSSWDKTAFHQPKSAQLHSLTGELQRLHYSAPAKSPTVVDVAVYNKHDGLQRAYFRYGLHAWEERLKPYLHHRVTLFVAENRQVWGVEVAGRMVLTTMEIEQRLLGMKLAQQHFADKMLLVGVGMVLFWLLFLRRNKVGAKCPQDEGLEQK